MNTISDSHEMADPNEVAATNDGTIDSLYRLEDLLLDLPAVVGAFSQRLHKAGVPVTPWQSEQYARSLGLTQPVSLHQLYWTTRAVFVTSFQQVSTFDRVFREVFGSTAKSVSDDLEEPVPSAKPNPTASVREKGERDANEAVGGLELIQDGRQLGRGAYGARVSVSSSACR